jgi:predicted transcriptional regulator
MSNRTTISLSDEELKQLRELAKIEHRPISRQIVYMMHFYLKQKTEK